MQQPQWSKQGRILGAYAQQGKRLKVNLLINNSAKPHGFPLEGGLLLLASDNYTFGDAPHV
jgi:hypothetical protein